MEQVGATAKDYSDDVTCEPMLEDISCIPCGPADHIQESLETVEEANAAYFCRFCLHATDNLDELISPCQCTGTQKYVHLECLKRWQNTLVRREKDGSCALDDRAHRCNVCCARYSVAPVKPERQPEKWSWVPLVAGACFLLFLLVNVKSSFIPQGVLFLSFLYCARHHFGLVFLSTLCATFAASSMFPFRFILRLDGNGWPGFAVISYGPPIPDLAAGYLLVASPIALARTELAESVVLLTHHGRSGSTGLVFNQPLAVASDASHGHHFLGCPAKIPGCLHSLVPLHTFSGVSGAHVLIPDESSALQVSGSVEELANLKLKAGSSSILRIFHGSVPWQGGQLAGEIRAGMWGYVSIPTKELLRISPSSLWSTLAGDPRVQWMQKV
eukprot:jgi/Botrbrau1/15239/Bobra.0149s0092.1